MVSTVIFIDDTEHVAANALRCAAATNSPGTRCGVDRCTRCLIDLILLPRIGDVLSLRIARRIRPVEAERVVVSIDRCPIIVAQLAQRIVSRNACVARSERSLQSGVERAERVGQPGAERTDSGVLRASQRAGRVGLVLIVEIAGVDAVLVIERSIFCRSFFGFVGAGKNVK